MVKEWQTQLLNAANPEKIKIFSSFFKTGKGEYGEGDKFIGLSVPQNRSIAKKYISANFNDIDIMLQHEIHEYRLSGFLALVEKFKRSKDPIIRKDIQHKLRWHCISYRRRCL